MLNYSVAELRLNKLWLRVGMIVAIMTTALSGTVWAETYTMSMDSGTKNGTKDVHWTANNATLTHSNVSWSASFSGGSITNSNNYVQIGSKSSPFTTITLSTSGISGTITEVKVGCGAYNSNATVAVTVGGNAFGGNAQSVGAAPSTSGPCAQNTFSGSASGAIVVTITNGNSGRAGYIDYVSVTYSSGGSSSTPSLSVNPTSIAFGEKTINGSYQETFDVTFANLTENLTVSGFSGVTVSPTTISKDATSPATVTVTYAPTAEGNISGNVTVSNTDDEVSQTVAVTGSAYDPSNLTYYEKVTAAPSDWTGDYIFTGINSGNYYALTGVTSNLGTTAQVTVTEDGIASTSTTDAYKVTVAETTNGYSLYMDGVGYLSYSGSSNALHASEEFEESTCEWTISFASGVATITNVGVTGRMLQFNYNSGNPRFACYTSSQVKLTLFKLNDGTPSISANNVSIDYDAMNGSIAYTLSNATGNVIASVTTGSDWLTLGEITSSEVSFTCTANPNNTTREATVTLSFSGADNKDVTITQAAAPVTYTTIPALFDKATEVGSTATDVNVTFNNWVVSGVSTNGKNVFVTDNAGNGFIIYDTNGGLSDTYSVGNILSGTAVACKVQKFNGSAEVTGLNASDLTITTGGSVTAANIAMADLAGVNTGALVSYENLTCSVNSSKYYLTDGTTTLQVYNTLYAFGALEAGKTYNITGVYQQFNDTKEILPRSAADIVEYEDNRTAVATIGDDLTPTTINIDDIDDFSLTITPASGLTEGTDYIVVWETSDASILELADETYEAKAVGSVTVTVTVTPDDDTTYKEVSKAFTVNVIDPNAKGTIDNPYTVADVIAGKASGKTGVYVIGYIVGEFVGSTSAPRTSDFTTDANIALADEFTTSPTVAASIPVALPSDALKTAWGCKTNDGSTIGTKVIVCGNGASYFSVNGIKNTSSVTAVQSVTVSSAGYATFASDNALDFTGSSIKAFYATESAGTLSFTQVNKVPAGTGVLLYADGGATVDVPVFTGAADEVTGNVFVRGAGAAVTYTDNDQNYILFDGEDGIGFYRANNNTVATNRAYIHVNGNGVKGFVINLEDDATGISLMEDGRSQMEDGVIYNIAGQRISKMQKGINIVNGKKIMVK